MNIQSPARYSYIEQLGMMATNLIRSWCGRQWEAHVYGQGFDQACHPFFFGVTGRNNK